MKLEEDKVIQLYDYPGCVLQKGDRTMSLMWCEGSGKILKAYSKSVPVGLFLQKDYHATLARLAEAEWIIIEAFKRTEL